MTELPLQGAKRSRDAADPFVYHPPPAMQDVRVVPWLAVLLGGCGQILGADDYRTSSSPGCTGLTVPVNGRCETAAASASDCPNGFSVQDGACLPFFPTGPCPTGQKAAVGNPSCTAIDVSCSSTGFGVFATGGVYVQKGANGTGDSPDSPAAGIEQGIARARALGQKDVWIAAGEYDLPAPLVLDSGIRLNGTCQSAVVLHGTGSGPVVQIVPGSDGAALNFLSVTGGSVGVQVVGARSTSLASVWIHDVDGPGVVFDDEFDAVTTPRTGALLSDGGLAGDGGTEAVDAGAGPPAVGHLNLVTIEQVRGAGVEIWGSDVEITSSSVSDVAGMSALLPGHGIGAHPSAVSYPSWKPRRSTLTISRTVVARVHSAGLLVEGSDATVTESLVSGVTADADGTARGVVVEPRVATNVQASLVLDHVLVEHTGGVGVHVWSAPAKLDSVTIRDTGEAKTGSCTGDGLRIRLDTTGDKTLDAAPPDGALVTLSHSVIEKSRGAGVHVEGARVDVEDSIVRGTLTDACEGKYGDGLAAYSFPGRPAEARVVRSRIEASARNAIGSFGAQGTLTNSVLSCNTGGVVDTAPHTAFAVDAASQCGCDSGAAACAVAAGSAATPALHGTQGCEPGDDCVSWCFRDWFEAGGVTLITRRTLWTEDERYAPAFSGADGCLEFGSRPGRHHVFTSSPDYLAALAPFTFAGSGERNVGLFRVPTFSGHLSFVEGQIYGTQFDFRTGYMLSLCVCDPESPPIGDPQEGCAGRGIPGVRAELPGHPGRAVYESTGFATDRTLSQLTESCYVIWENVEPGDREILVHPPDSTGLDCETWAGVGVSGDALQGQDPVHVPIHVRAGYSSVEWIACHRVP